MDIFFSWSLTAVTAVWVSVAVLYLRFSSANVKALWLSHCCPDSPVLLNSTGETRKPCGSPNVSCWGIEFQFPSHMATCFSWSEAVTSYLHQDNMTPYCTRSSNSSLNLPDQLLLPECVLSFGILWTYCLQIWLCFTQWFSLLSALLGLAEVGFSLPGLKPVSWPRPVQSAFPLCFAFSWYRI